MKSHLTALILLVAFSCVAANGEESDYALFGQHTLINHLNSPVHAIKRAGSYENLSEDERNKNDGAVIALFSYWKFYHYGKKEVKHKELDRIIFELAKKLKTNDRIHRVLIKLRGGEGADEKLALALYDLNAGMIEREYFIDENKFKDLIRGFEKWIIEGNQP